MPRVRLVMRAMGSDTATIRINAPLQNEENVIGPPGTFERGRITTFITTQINNPYSITVAGMFLRMKGNLFHNNTNKNAHAVAIMM